MQTTHQTPIQRVMALVTKVQSLKPMRVWTRVGARDGMVLAAGISYQALFALFAAFYVVFAIVGLWLGTNRDAMNSLIDGFNGFLPGIITETDGGLLTRDQVIEIAAGATGILSVTGFVAFIAVVMTSIGWVSFSRIGVRRMLGLGTQEGNPILVQVRDLVAAVVFALMLGIGSAIGALSTVIVRSVLGTVRLDAGWLVDSAVTLVSFAVAMGVDVLMLRLYFRFLVDAKIPSRLVWPGAVIGGAGMAVLQSLAGLLIGGTPSNPLLAAFAFLIGLLLWFRLISIVLLVAAAWIRVSADDHGIDLAPPTVEQQREAVEEARIITARLRLEEAERARRHAPWYRRRRATADVRAAQDELRRLQHDRRDTRSAA